MERLRIKFFVDHNVPESVSKVLETAGHEVTRLKSVMLTDTEDAVIEAACTHSGHVLVTHDKDFIVARKRLGLTRKEFNSKLHKIQLRCEQFRSWKRIEEAMSLIEHEWLQVKADRPMVINISDETIRIER